MTGMLNVIYFLQSGSAFRQDVDFFLILWHFLYINQIFHLELVLITFFYDNVKDIPLYDLFCLKDLL